MYSKVEMQKMEADHEEKLGEIYQELLKIEDSSQEAKLQLMIDSTAEIRQKQSYQNSLDSWTFPNFAVSEIAWLVSSKLLAKVRYPKLDASGEILRNLRNSSAKDNYAFLCFANSANRSNSLDEYASFFEKHEKDFMVDGEIVFKDIKHIIWMYILDYLEEEGWKATCDLKEIENSSNPYVEFKF